MSVVKEINIKTIDNDYIPIIFDNTIDNDIFKNKLNPKLNDVIEYPKFSFGFHHFIHQSKDKMEIIEQFKNKKKVYYVISKFERYIDDYDNDLDKVSKKYFDIKNRPNILSRAFFKLWEIFFLFDIIQLDKKNFISAHLAEGPGSFVQATMFYRDKFTKGVLSKNDKYYAITLHSDKESIPAVHSNFIKYYKKEKPERFFLHKTFSRKDSNKDHGDLTEMITIKNFSKNFKTKKADLVTADGGFDWDNENLQEQEILKLLFGQIITALHVQNKDGNFVCKIFESFTIVTAKIIHIMSTFYTKVYLVKPLTSRKSNSEKYMVCIKFNPPKDYEKKIKILEELLENMKKENKKYLINFFPDFNISKEFIINLINTNITVANRQFESINEIIDYINKQNYRGDEYNKRRKMQIAATKFWVDKFYPDVNNFKSNKKLLEDFKDTIIINNENKEFSKKLE